MKRHLSLLAILLIAFVANAADYGYNSNEVPADWQNDLWVNADYVEMTLDSVHQIRPRRIPEAIDDPINNNVTLPTFHYTIVEGNNIEVSADGKISAKELGRAVIEITYDALNANNKVYPACSDVNKTYVVVNVIDKSIEHGITISTNIKPGHYDTYYYTSGNGFDLTFNANIANATKTDVTINNQKIAANADGSYTVRLKNRANILEIEASNDKGSKHWAQVIDARKIDINVVNKTNSGQPIRVGDKAQISFKGIVLPVEKLAAIYNPQMGQWGGKPAQVIYNNNKLGSVKTINPTQYDLPTKNAIEVTFNEAGEYVFNSGHIFEAWWGAGLGTDKTPDGKTPGAGGGIAPTMEGEFCKLPAFRIQVQPKLDGYKDIATLDVASTIETNGIVLDSVAADTIDGIIYNNIAWDERITNNEGFLDGTGMLMFSHTGDTKYNSWSGFAFSKSNYNLLGRDDYFPSRQWGCYAGQGMDNSPYLIAYCPMFMESESNHVCQIVISTGEPMTILGTYINNATWTANDVINGSFARKFQSGDKLKLIAHGLNTEFNDNGKSVEFLLADYSNKNSENWILNDQWEWMDLRGLGDVAGVYFTMESTDVDPTYGMNTAAYFALDKFTYANKVSGPATGVEDLNSESLSIYPNPCQNILYIDNAAGEMVTIYNLQGQIVLNETVGINGIDVSRLNSGIYVVKCLDKTEKLMIK